MNLEPYLINPDELQVGSIVYHIVIGPISITHITNATTCFRCSNGSSYDRDGKYLNTNRHPTIYKSNPFETPEPIVSEYPKLMNVWNDNSVNNKLSRLVITKYNDRFIAIDGNHIRAQASGSCRTMSWQYAEDIPITPKTVLSKADIARLAGCEVGDLEILED